MSSPDDNTSPHARAFYDNLAARRRQLSSGPLGGDNLYSLVVFVAPNLYVCSRSIGVQRASLLLASTKYSMDSLSICIYFKGIIFLEAKRSLMK
jgi:hypothetical protein